MEPLAEKGWRLRPANYEPFKYLLLGIPNELTLQEGRVIQYMPSIHPVEKLAERPGYIDEPAVPTFLRKDRARRGSEQHSRDERRTDLRAARDRRQGEIRATRAAKQLVSIRARSSRLT